MEYIVRLKDLDRLKEKQFNKDEDHVHLIAPKRGSIKIDDALYLLEDLGGKVSLTSCDVAGIPFLVSGIILTAKSQITVLSDVYIPLECLKGGQVINDVSEKPKKKRVSKSVKQEVNAEDGLAADDMDGFEKSLDSIELCTLLDIKNCIPKSSSIESVTEHIALAFSSGNSNSDARNILLEHYERTFVDIILNGARKNNEAFRSLIGDINVKLTYGLYD